MCKRKFSFLLPGADRLYTLIGEEKNCGETDPASVGLNDYFDYNSQFKEHSLTEIRDFLADRKSHFFIPEVNSKNEDLISIVQDFQRSGFEFI